MRIPGLKKLASLPRSALAKKLLLGAGLAALVVVLMLWLTGAFHKKVAPGGAAKSADPRNVGVSTRTYASETLIAVPVRYVEIPAIETAPGTIRPVYEAAVASRLFEKVASIDIKAGQQVKKGQLLIQLDKTVWKNRLEQAQSTLEVAKANENDAKQDLQRKQEAYNNKVATIMELETARNKATAAHSELRHAEQALEESQTTLGYCDVLSPMDGIVIDKKVNVGDTVAAGQVLLTLYDPSAMQLVASVRESLAERLKVGQEIDVRVSSLDQVCHGRVSEIVPEAEAASRSFAVKVTGPCPKGAYTGTYGRLLIPLGTQKVLVIPPSAIQQVGQLTLVEVADGKTAARRAVQLGRNVEYEGASYVQVLSGLKEGESVLAVPAPATRPSASQPAATAPAGGGAAHE